MAAAGWNDMPAERPQEHRSGPVQPAGGTGVQAKRIVLLGGSGDVGSRLARLLLENTDAAVTVVSRHAGGHDGQFGDRLRHVSFDLSGGGNLTTSPKDIVVNLTEVTPPSVARQVVERGGWFLETSATPGYLSAIQKALEGTPGGGIAILCVGVAPGLTNLLAAEIATRARDTVHIDIGVEMGMGRHYGFAATEWFLRTAGQPYNAFVEHVPREVAPGRFRRKLAFRSGHPPRHAIGYGFAEQQVIAERSGRQLKTVRSFVALDPAWMTRLLAVLLALGLGPAIGRKARGLTRWLLRTPAIGRSLSRFVLEGFDDAGHLTGRIRLETGDQAKASAVMTYATIQSILERGRPEHGAVTTITDHLSLDAALRMLRRFLPGTQVTDSFADDAGKPNEMLG